MIIKNSVTKTKLLLYSIAFFLRYSNHSFLFSRSNGNIDPNYITLASRKALHWTRSRACLRCSWIALLDLSTSLYCPGDKQVGFTIKDL